MQIKAPQQHLLGPLPHTSPDLHKSGSCMDEGESFGARALTRHYVPIHFPHSPLLDLSHSFFLAPQFRGRIGDILARNVGTVSKK